MKHTYRMIDCDRCLKQQLSGLLRLQTECIAQFNKSRCSSRAKACCFFQPPSKPSHTESAKRKSQPHNSFPTLHQPINVVRYRHPMGSVALPDCSAEAVSKQSQGHAQQSQVTCASGWPPRDSNRAPMVGLLPTAGVQRKIEVISFH
jgi:hypothetical protein